MVNGPDLEGVIPTEPEVTSPTEASRKWEVNYGPTLKQTIAGATGLVIGIAGWSFGHADLETTKIAAEQGLYTLAVLKGMLGVSEVIAGISGAAAGIGWAKRDQDNMLARNPKPPR